MDDDARVVGVGPHPEPWPDDPRFDPDLLEEGAEFTACEAMVFAH